MDKATKHNTSSYKQVAKACRKKIQTKFPQVLPNFHTKGFNKANRGRKYA